MSETLLQEASERGGQAIVLGAHEHGQIVGGTLRGVTRDATRPVVVARAHGTA